MSVDIDRNKDFVLEAFDVLFNRRDYAAAARYWSDDYVQHSAHIGPGRDGLFDLIRSLPRTLRYENQFVVAEGDQVMLYGRFSGTGREIMVDQGPRLGAYPIRSTVGASSVMVSAERHFGDPARPVGGHWPRKTEVRSIVLGAIGRTRP